jgi:hypothetical protein
MGLFEQRRNDVERPRVSIWRSRGEPKEATMKTHSVAPRNPIKPPRSVVRPKFKLKAAEAAFIPAIEPLPRLSLR